MSSLISSSPFHEALVVPHKEMGLQLLGCIKCHTYGDEHRRAPKCKAIVHEFLIDKDRYNGDKGEEQGSQKRHACQYCSDVFRRGLPGS